MRPTDMAGPRGPSGLARRPMRRRDRFRAIGRSADCATGARCRAMRVFRSAAKAAWHVPFGSRKRAAAVQPAGGGLVGIAPLLKLLGAGSHLPQTWEPASMPGACRATRGDRRRRLNPWRL